MHTDFHSGCTSLHNLQQCMRVPTPPLPHILGSICWQSDWGEIKSWCNFDLHFLYDLGCWTFLHLFFSHLTFFFWELCSIHLAIYQLDHLFFCYSVLWAHCLFWILTPYLLNSYQRFLSVGCLLILVIVSFDVQKLFNLMQFYLSMLALIS
jgi:hypothetical protein